MKRTLALTLALALAPPLAAEEVLTIEGARIRGNQELPTVLYLVPWQPPATGPLEPEAEDVALVGREPPLERSAFLREVQYHHRFQEQAREAEAARADDP